MVGFFTKIDHELYRNTQFHVVNLKQTMLGSKNDLVDLGLQKFLNHQLRC